MSIMKSFALALLLAAAAAAQDTAFTGARVIDGTGKAPVEKATILVRNGRISAIGPAVKIPDGAQRIDLTGKTIIPGLINGHGHVGDLAQLGLYARYGITT